MEMYNYGPQAMLYEMKSCNVRSIYSNFVFTVLSQSWEFETSGLFQGNPAIRLNTQKYVQYGRQHYLEYKQLTVW